MKEALQLKLDDVNKLTFHLSLMGTTEMPGDIRFICSGDNLSYSFKGTITQGNNVVVTIPPMRSKAPAGVYRGKLEVIVEGMLLTPFECDVIFNVAQFVHDSDLFTETKNSLKQFHDSIEEFEVVDILEDFIPGRKR